ncbi:hypothetical protein EDD17DRAFT_1454024, partial [Pisolithus thermaeus]
RNNFTVMLCSDLAMDVDIQILQIDQLPHTLVIVANIYNQRAGDDLQSWTLDCLQNIVLLNNLPLVISGDWNLHHPMWSMD